MDHVLGICDSAREHAGDAIFEIGPCIRNRHHEILGHVCQVQHSIVNGHRFSRPADHLKDTRESCSKFEFLTLLLLNVVFPRLDLFGRCTGQLQKRSVSLVHRLFHVKPDVIPLERWKPFQCLIADKPLVGVCRIQFQCLFVPISPSGHHTLDVFQVFLVCFGQRNMSSIVGFFDGLPDLLFLAEWQEADPISEEFVEVEVVFGQVRHGGRLAGEPFVPALERSRKDIEIVGVHLVPTISVPGEECHAHLRHGETLRSGRQLGVPFLQRVVVVEVAVHPESCELQVHR
mmetsp:Transcript_1940/g.12183  ORF Transcript_1940/g.12183 Transcript_1940/m.12183 type:complete len:288 (+) Transcript_1940:5693-6556(+)